MFSWLTNAWRVPELRRRVIFTAVILALYRLGSWIPAPGVDSQTIKDYFNGHSGTILGLLSVFSGGALSRFALFALGIMPYVTASIILQLMTVVVPKLRITQVRSQIGETQRHRGTLRALGLGKIGRSVEKEETPVLAGMLRKVRHLVRIEESG